MLTKPLAICSTQSAQSCYYFNQSGARPKTIMICMTRVFPRLATGACFLRLATGACFPRLATGACFPRLETVASFPLFSRARVQIGALHCLICLYSFPRGYYFGFKAVANEQTLLGTHFCSLLLGRANGGTFVLGTECFRNFFVCP